MARALQVLGVAIIAFPLVLLAARRRRRRASGSRGPAPIERRAFLNRALLGSLAVFGVAFGAGSLAVLWPQVRTGVGGKIVAGKLSDILSELKLASKPIYNIAGRFYIVPYTITDPNNPYVREGLAGAGIMVLSQKCSHLGCRVPFCSSSGWFECPCHDARFNLAGEVMNPPAPAGMWRYPFEITRDGDVVVDTRQRVGQPPMGTDTLHQSPAGEHCVQG